jgi:OOP family OmpA-OmpF porin
VLPPDTGTPGAPDDDLESIRSILVGPAEQQLRTLQARMDDRFSHAREVGSVLPQALLHRAQDPELARALRTPVERAITDAVRENPQPLADAIFPIIGPAIRRAVAATLATMLESFNRTLEHSISWRSLQWRFEAFRTGKPFGEVVLLHTLLYRVEQVFLVHRESGLLLQHVQAGAAPVQDAQMVSAMLTAIRDFVSDSFRVGEQESLDALRVGELSVWIEQGPSAIVAVVIRGTAPQELRQVLQRAVETIHVQFGNALDAFKGDTQPFEPSRPILEECLQAGYRGEAHPPARRVWVLAALVLLGLGVWLAFSWREQRRWTGYLDRLKQEPGLVVISAGRSGGRYVVAGLRDPLARDPATLLRESALSPADVAGRWDPYEALLPPFVLARAHRILNPPAGVSLTLENGVLAASGAGTAAWIADARRMAPLIAGISGFDDSAMVAATLSALIQRIESATILFARGTPTPLDGQSEPVRALAADLKELDLLAAATGRAFRIDVRGHTDADGAAAANLPLSRARAERAAAMLDLGATPRLDIVTNGLGSDDPSVAGATEPDKQRNRRVAIRVTAAAPASQGTRR